jgi:hypothetical protein
MNDDLKILFYAVSIGILFIDVNSFLITSEQPMFIVWALIAAVIAAIPNIRRK